MADLVLEHLDRARADVEQVTRREDLAHESPHDLGRSHLRLHALGPDGARVGEPLGRILLGTQIREIDVLAVPRSEHRAEHRVAIPSERQRDQRLASSVIVGAPSIASPPSMLRASRAASSIGGASEKPVSSLVPESIPASPRAPTGPTSSVPDQRSCTPHPLGRSTGGSHPSHATEPRECGGRPRCSAATRRRRRGHRRRRLHPSAMRRRRRDRSGT